jgi:O-antigen ligase
VVGTSFVFDSHGEDRFRLPKELVFRGGAVVIAAALAMMARRDMFKRDVLRQPHVAIGLAALAWASIVTVTSTNRLLSFQSWITVACSVAFAFGVAFVARRASLSHLYWLMIPAVVNAVVAALQEYRIWQPFTMNEEFLAGHISTTALIGNPNDVGTFLVLPALAAIVVAILTTGTRRRTFAAIAVVLLAGLLASVTRTALIAYCVGVVAIITRFRKATILLAAAVLVIAIVAISPRTPLGRSVHALFDAVSSRQYNVLLSDRLPAFLAAYEMWKDRPLLGQGPGTFKFHFMPVRIELSKKYAPELLQSTGTQSNYGETHNDHLQILAEAGLPAYLIFLAALASLVMRARAASRSTEARFAIAFGLPLAVSFFVLALAQFPLQIAAPRSVVIYLAVLCSVWSRDA